MLVYDLPQSLTRGGQAIESNLSNSTIRKSQVFGRARSIRVYCLELCCCGQHKERGGCELIYCPLWCYRFGRRPTEQEVRIYESPYQYLGDYLAATGDEYVPLSVVPKEEEADGVLEAD